MIASLKRVECVTGLSANSPIAVLIGILILEPQEVQAPVHRETTHLVRVSQDSAMESLLAFCLSLKF